jgi:outer membrane protein
MMRIVTTLTALALSAVAAPAFSQAGLLDVYQRAMMNDPVVREAEATYLATAETKPQRLAVLLPNLTASANSSNQFSDSVGGFDVGGGISTGDNRNISDSDSEGWRLSLRQTLFNWSNLAQLRQADKIVARAETTYEAAKQELLVRVAERYFNVLAAEDNVASAIAAREAIARQLEQAQRRYEVGLIAITDVQQSQAGYDDSVAAEIEAQRQLSTTHEFLREIIGEVITELASPQEELPLTPPNPANPEQWVQTAMQQNLTLVSSRISTEVALDDIAIQRANRLPTLSLTAAYNENTQDRLTTSYCTPNPPSCPVSGIRQTPSLTRPDGRNWSLDLTFPIYTGGLNRSRIQQAVYTHRAANEALERVARQTERQTRDAYLGVISEIQRVRALRQSVESNRTALRATQAGFEVGTQTAVDVLSSQNSLRRAETTYSRSRYDYILNILRLKQAAGTLAVVDVEEVDGWLQQ